MNCNHCKANSNNQEFCDPCTKKILKIIDFYKYSNRNTIHVDPIIIIEDCQDSTCLYCEAMGAGKYLLRKYYD